jgi:hypothetical protein
MIEPPVWPLAVLGAILGATCGSLIALHAGSKSDQWAWAFIAGLILAEYLTLVGLALYSGRSIPQAIVASAFSAPIVILVGIVGLLAILVVFFGAAFAVPVTIVFSAIYLLPPLSFILAWPPEVIAAITMPFVVLWVILLVELSGWKSTEQAHEKKTRFRRVGRFINNVLDVVITFLYRIVDRLRSSRAGPWLVVAGRPWPFGLALFGATILWLPFALIDIFVFGFEFSERHEANAAAVVGAGVGGLYGAGVGCVAWFVSGLGDIGDNS